MTDVPQAKSNYTDFWSDKIDDFDKAYLVRSAQSHVVWLDKDGDIDWMTTDEYDQKGPKDQQKSNAILSDAAILECAPCHGLSGDTKRHFKRLVAEGLSYNFDDDYRTAQQMMREAQAYIKVRSEEISRRWYLSASAAMAAIMILLGGIVWLYRQPIATSLTADFTWLFLAAVAGSCGALLSVIWRSGQIKFDCSAGKALHFLEGASRIWAGALSGVLVALAVKSEFILAPLMRGGNTMTVIMLAAFAAGAGERLATSIISTFESTHPTTTTGRDKGRKGNDASE